MDHKRAVATPLDTDEIDAAAGRSRFRPPEIAGILDQVDRAAGTGRNVADACRAVGISPATYYRWRQRDLPMGRQGGQPMAEPRRDAIIAAAKIIFLRDGYSASLDDIAAAAGVARQTLYNQFGSKERLFRAVVQAIFSRMLLPVLRVSGMASVRETLLHFGRQYIDASLDPEGLALLRLTAGEYREFPDLGKIVHSSGASRTVPVLADYLQTQVEAGALRPIDPMIAAESFLGSLVGYARHRALVGIGIEPAERREALLHHAVETFVRGVRAEH
jgi:AcrR family transcriptional regulator